MYDVITIGSATVDVFAKTHSEMIKFSTENAEKEFIAFPLGDKLLINKLDFYIGGGGTNTATAFARLGLRTGYIGKIGKEENGERVLNHLHKENIDFLGSREGTTGYSIILDSIEEDRTILTYKGSNNTLRINDINHEQFLAEWLYSSSMVGESFTTLLEVFKEAKQKGMKIAFNPSSYQTKKRLSVMESYLELIDVLILNHEEAEELLGRNGCAEELSPQLQYNNKQIIIITEGAKGATALHEGTFYYITPSPHLKIEETTGAGDAFAAGFIAGLVRKYRIEDALKLGMVEAEACIEHTGAKNGLLTKEESFQRLGAFTGTISTRNKQRKTNTTRTSLKSISKSISKSPVKKQLLNTKEQRTTTQEPEQEREYYQQQKQKATGTKNVTVPKGKEFILKNGVQIRTTRELAEELQRMPESIFRHHVHPGTNHFANWVEDVFGEKELAKKMRKYTTKIALSVLLKQELNKVKE